MSDRSPRLSDENPFDTVMGSAFADAGVFRDPVDTQYERDHDPEARFLRENGVDEETLDAAERDEIDTARELGREEMEELYGPGQQSSTAGLIEDAALYGARPLASETDTRHVWINGDEPISFDGPLPANEQAAFDQLGEGIDLMADVVTPDGFRMAEEREPFLWAIAHAFHAQMERVEKRVSILTQEARQLGRTEGQRIKEQGRDAASLELENVTHELEAVAAMRDHWERFRDYTADLYLHHTTKVWEPRRGSSLSQTRGTARRIDSREYIRARQAGHDTRDIPEGTLIAVAGGKIGPDRDTVYKALDREHEQYPDMILAHGGARDGVQKIASTWARNRGVPEMPFLPDWGAHKSQSAVIVQRDITMLRAGPAAVLHFTTPDQKVPRICEEARRRGVHVEPVMDRPARQQAAALSADTSRRPSTLDRIRERRDAIPLHEDIDNPLPELTAGQLPDHVEISLGSGRTAILERASPAPANDRHDQTEPGFTTASKSRHDNPIRPETLDRQQDVRYAEAVLGPPALAAEPDPAAYTAALGREPTPGEAFHSFVDTLLPDTEEHETTRKHLFHRIVDVVHGTIAGPEGLTEKVDKHARRQKELDREFSGGEITLNQMNDTAEELQTASSALDRLDNARAALATTAEQQTGERWTPRPAAQIGESPTVSAAAAEAIQVMERIDRKRDLARLPQGFPIAVSALDDEADRETVRAKMDQMREHRPDMWIAHANSHGTLSHVAEWASERGVKQVTFELGKGDAGTAAIRRRDHRIIDTVRPKGIIEFTAEGARKTFLVNKATEEKIPIWDVNMTKERARQQQEQNREQDKAQDRTQTENIRETLSMGAGQGRSW